MPTLVLVSYMVLQILAVVVAVVYDLSGQCDDGNFFKHKNKWKWLFVALFLGHLIAALSMLEDKYRPQTKE